MASASDISESSKSFVTIVENCVECPVCLETVKVPFKQCSRGHVVCVSCTTKISKCPTCEEPFTQENPVSLKNILEALPRNCIYSQDGCKEIVETGNDHEEFCGYRLISCRYCDVKMPVVKVLDHLREHHGNIGIITKIHVEQLEYTTLEFFGQFKSSYGFTPVWLFDNFFWILCLLDRESDVPVMKQCFLVTPIGKLDHDYYVRVTIENGGFVVTNTLKATSYEENIKFFDLIKGKITMLDESFRIEIPVWRLNDWKSKTKKETNVKLNFFKMKKE